MTRCDDNDRAVFIRNEVRVIAMSITVTGRKMPAGLTRRAARYAEEKIGNSARSWTSIRS